jgi:hypothetical protein
VRRDTPRPKSTELPSSTTIVKPEKEQKESRPSSQSAVQREKGSSVEKVEKVPAPSGAWGGKGLSLAEKMKNDLQKKDEPVQVQMVVPKPVVAAPQVVEQDNVESDVRKESTPPPDSTTTSAKNGGKKSRNRRGKGNNNQKSTDEKVAKDQHQDVIPESKNESEDHVDKSDGVVMDDLFITGKSMKINKPEEQPETSTVNAKLDSVVDSTSDKVTSPKRKGKKETVPPIPNSPQAVILGNFDVGDDDTNFSFGNFGEESPDRRKKGGKDNNKVSAESTHALSMESFMNKPEENSNNGGINVASASTTEAFGGLTTSGSSGPPGFGATSSTVTPSNTAPIQQPTHSKGGRKSKGNKDHNQQSHQQQDPFGQTTAPPGMQTQSQQRNNQQPFHNSVYPFGMSSQMYGLDPGAGLVQPPLMGGGYDSVYSANSSTKNTSEIATASGNSASTSATNTNTANSNSNNTTNSPSTSPGVGFQGQGNQPQQGYPSSNQPNMSQMGGYFPPPYGNHHPYYGHHYFYGGQPAHNFYGGRGGQNIYPRPYGDGFGAGGQGMGYDMYNHNQGGMNGQFDSSALGYNQHMQHMHPNQQHANQHSGNDGNASSNSGMEGGGSSRQKNKNSAGNNSNSQTGPHGNSLHEHAPNNFAAGGASVGAGGNSYNQFVGGRQDPQQHFAGNMYMQQNSFPHMMPPFHQPLANSPPPGTTGLGGSAGSGYSQVGGANSFSNRGGSGGANNYNRSGGVNHSQNPPSTMANMSGSNNGNASSSTTPSNW